MRFNLQTKLFLLLAGLTSLVLVAVLWAVNGTLSSVTRADVIQDFERMQAQFKLDQALRYDRLVESALLIGENSTFKANVTLDDPASMQYILSEFAQFTKADLLVVTNREGQVLAHFGVPDGQSRGIRQRPSVRRALNGQDPALEPDWPELWALGGGAYQVATVPVYAGRRVAGTLTLGARLTQTEAFALKGDTPTEISFFLGDSLLAATAADSVRGGAGPAFPKVRQATIEQVLRAHAPSRPFEATVGGAETFAFVSPLGTGAPAYYAATVPKATLLSSLHRLQRTLLVYALLSLLFTVGLAVTLGRLVTRPVKRLARAMRRIEAGDLGVEVAATTQDEIGQLTRSFNAMVVGLRERFQLTRYVGSHTMDMIRASKGADGALGGARRELAVLFSDIRGFTAYSEARPPEEVVAVLNACLGAQAQCVRAHGGSVDKYVGDEMVALFDGPDGLHRALRCAVAIQAHMRTRPADDAPLHVGVGVNYGPMVLGNMGADDRRDYTVIGSAVNLGARLCSAAAAGQVLVREALLHDVDGGQADFAVGAVRSIPLKGFSAPVQVAEIEAAPDAEPTLPLSESTNHQTFSHESVA